MKEDVIQKSRDCSPVRIGLPDGNGVFGGYEFWSDYCKAIGVTLVDVSHDLDTLKSVSRDFPTNICLASKYRLGRSLLLIPKVDFLVFFLFDDKYVYNCPNSVYRINWIKAYIDEIGLCTKVIVWPLDLPHGENFQEKCISLAKRFKGDIEKGKFFISHYNNFPQKKLQYDFKYDCNKKNILLIGKAPFRIDPYRRTKLMDALSDKFGILLPHLITNNDTSCLSEKGSNVVFYKEKSIKLAIDNALNLYDLHGVVFVADIFDIPGNYTFPVLKSYLRSLGIPFVHIKMKHSFDEHEIEDVIGTIEQMH